MIKAISWDMGRVLRARHLEDKSWHRKWETYLDLVPGQLEEIVFSSHQTTRGEITPAEVWQDARALISKVELLCIELLDVHKAFEGS